MATVHGGLSQLGVQTQQVSGPGQAQHSSEPGQLNLASITDVHTTVAGGGDTVGGSGQPSTSGVDTVGGAGQGSTSGVDTVGGAGQGSASGFDTVTGPSQGSGGFAGQPQGGGTEQVAATQTQAGGNTVLHLPDGSTITVAGTSHVDASFFH
jgi:hypothetical protein